MTVLGLEVRNNVTLPPSNKARNARIRKGAVFPTNSYITLPNGGPTVTETMINFILSAAHVVFQVSI